MRRKALRDSGITSLKQILDFARAMDATDSHLTEMEDPHINTDRVDDVRKRSNYKPQLSEKKCSINQRKCSVKQNRTKVANLATGVVENSRTLNSVLLLNKSAISARRRVTLRKYV